MYVYIIYGQNIYGSIVVIAHAEKVGEIFFKISTCKKSKRIFQFFVILDRLSTVE